MKPVALAVGGVLDDGVRVCDTLALEKLQRDSAAALGRNQGDKVKSVVD